MGDNPDEVIFKVLDNSLVIEMNRPEKNNVFDNGIRKQIMDFLMKHEVNGKIKSVIFTSNGKNFSLGADIKNLLSLDGKTVGEYAEFVKKFLNYVQNYPKVTIGAVHGIAVGGGLELLLALDIVVAADDSRFGQTELNVGLIPGGGGTQRLPEVMGLRKAREMIFTGSLINADEALRYGLVNRIVPVDSLMEETMKVSASVSAKSSISISLAKKAINERLKPMEKALDLESDLYKDILLAEDGKEGLKAFLEKRKPSYKD